MFLQRAIYNCVGWQELTHPVIRALFQLLFEKGGPSQVGRQAPARVEREGGRVGVKRSCVCFLLLFCLLDVKPVQIPGEFCRRRTVFFFLEGAGRRPIEGINESVEKQPTL